MHPIIAKDQAPALAPDSEEVTFFVRNLPREITQEELRSTMDTEGFADTYNFLYVPQFFGDSSNKGYAFVNFFSLPAAEAFWKSWHGRATSEDCPIGVTMSALQGLQANVKKWSPSRCKRIRDGRRLPFVRMDATAGTRKTASAALPPAPAAVVPAVNRNPLAPPPGNNTPPRGVSPPPVYSTHPAVFAPYMALAEKVCPPPGLAPPPGLGAPCLGAPLQPPAPPGDHGKVMHNYFNGHATSMRVNEQDMLEELARLRGLREMVAAKEAAFAEALGFSSYDVRTTFRGDRCALVVSV